MESTLPPSVFRLIAALFLIRIRSGSSFKSALLSRSARASVSPLSTEPSAGYRTWTAPPPPAGDDTDAWSVLDGLYPPRDVEKRNAISRTDGYWSYVNEGLDPPSDFTYGEFDASFFRHLVGPECALRLWKGRGGDRRPVVVDLGSGAGRLVLYSALMEDGDAALIFGGCRGVEALPGLHGAAADAAAALPPSPGRPPVAVLFVNAPFADVYATDSALVDADVVFSFSSCMSQETRADLDAAVGRSCGAGTVVITTDGSLPSSTPDGARTRPDEYDPAVPHGWHRTELVEVVEGPCEAMGGQTTAYVHVVLESEGHKMRLLQQEEYEAEMEIEGKPSGGRVWKNLVRPVIPPERLAFEAIRKIESDGNRGVKKFMLKVYNSMAFEGVEFY
mmetsp:Transcript_39920/g.77989  ORF Transcript_39920/g.77989 Transcript_39920/m.77989 type:complete len:390 (-) Transcript_39920:164-1333(-)